MDSPEVSNKEPDQAKRRKIEGAEYYKVRDSVEEWVEPERRHRLGKSSKNKAEKDPSVGEKRRGGDGIVEVVDEERAGGKKRGDRVDGSWDESEENSRQGHKRRNGVEKGIKERRSSRFDRHAREGSREDYVEAKVDRGSRAAKEARDEYEGKVEKGGSQEYQDKGRRQVEEPVEYGDKGVKVVKEHRSEYDKRGKSSREFLDVHAEKGGKVARSAKDGRDEYAGKAPKGSREGREDHSDRADRLSKGGEKEHDDGDERGKLECRRDKGDKSFRGERGQRDLTRRKITVPGAKGEKDLVVSITGDFLDTRSESRKKGSEGKPSRRSEKQHRSEDEISVAVEASRRWEKHRGEDDNLAVVDERWGTQLGEPVEHRAAESGGREKDELQLKVPGVDAGSKRSRRGKDIESKKSGFDDHEITHSSDRQRTGRDRDRQARAVKEDKEVHLDKNGVQDQAGDFDLSNREMEAEYGGDGGQRYKGWDEGEEFRAGRRGSHGKGSRVEKMDDAWQEVPEFSARARSRGGERTSSSRWEDVSESRMMGRGERVEREERRKDKGEERREERKPDRVDEERRAEKPRGREKSEQTDRLDEGWDAECMNKAARKRVERNDDWRGDPRQLEKEKSDWGWEGAEDGGRTGGRRVDYLDDADGDRHRGMRDKVDTGWEDVDKTGGKRERADDSRDRQRGVRERERLDGGWEDFPNGAKQAGRKSERVEDSRDRPRGIRERAEGGWDELEGSGRSGRTKRAEEEKLDKHRASRVLGHHESEDGVRSSGRGGRGDEDRDRSKGRDALEAEWESDDGRSGGRSRGVKVGRVPSSSPDGRGPWLAGEFDEYDRDWSDGKEEQERDKLSRRSRDRQRDRDRERERAGREKEMEWGRESRERGREWEEPVDRRKDRYRDRHKDRDDKGRDGEPDLEPDAWDMDRRRERSDRERAERDRLARDRVERDVGDRDRVQRERMEDIKAKSGDVRGGGNGLSVHMDAGRGFIMPHGGPFLPRGDVFQGEVMGSGEHEWEGHMPDERMRMGDGVYLAGGDPRERYLIDDEGSHEQNFGRSPGRGGGDGATSFSHHGGRVRGPKVSPNNRGRGVMMVGHDVRTPFMSNQGAGQLSRSMQQQGKVGRGGRGMAAKGGRGGGLRDGRGLISPVMGPGPGPGPGLGLGPGPGHGPGMGPHFGHLGPPGMLGMGPGMGPGPGIGPGGFPIPPFGGPMGWGSRGGEMGMMGGLPGPGPGLRFGPGMGPGPGPNMFFNPSGPGRGGGLGGMPGVMFGGGPYGARGMPADRGLVVGRGVGRGSIPAGRGPSRGEQNDYSQHFVDTGLRPQNFIRDVELADRFEEYPKLKELISRKDRLIADNASPPMYMQCDLRSTELKPEMFGTKFDVILVDPPWEEYVRRAPGVGDSMEWWSHDDIQNLRIEAIADTPAFIFLWVGDAEGLDQGRLCLKKWGFRRCEDICWVKTNRENPTPALRHDANTLFQHSKEHCLMGIKGTVRRSTDAHIIHANVDTDIIISEEPPYGSMAKPEELYHIIEHFAQGQRRLELFGEDHNIRAGWVTVGKGLSSSNFNPTSYAKFYADGEGKVWHGGRGNPPIDAPHLVGTTPEIEALRPKSPPPRAQPSPAAANSGSQPSAANSNSKKATQGGSGQNGVPPQQQQGGLNLAPGAGHGTPAIPTIAVHLGQVPGLSRGGGHGQVPPPKTRSAQPGSMPKPLGAGPGMLSLDMVMEEEPSSSRRELPEVCPDEENGQVVAAGESKPPDTPPSS